MNIIRRVALVVAFALLFAVGVNAQDSCQVKVVVGEVNWDGSGEPKFGYMTQHQRDWWEKEGQKKFPKICLVSTKDEAEYRVGWKYLESADKYSYTVPNTSTTNASGTVVGPGGVGTYSGTATTTTYETKEGEWPVWYVKAAVFKKGGGGQILFSTHHKGQWRWSKPDKDAFQKSLEFINKQLK